MSLNVTTVYINSKDLSTGFPTNFTYNLAPLGMDSVISYYIKQISIPYSAYSTVYPDTTLTNSAYVTVSDSHGLSNVVIGAGNYTASTLASAFQTALNSAPGSRDTTYTVVYNVILNKFVISNAEDFTIYWSTGKNLNGQQLYLTFGFTSANSTGSTSYTSINASQTSGTSLNYYLKSRFLTIDGSYAYFNGTKDNVVLQVPIDVNTNGIIEYINFNRDFLPIRGENINSIDLELVDEYNNDVQLNGLNWTCVIVFRNK